MSAIPDLTIADLDDWIADTEASSWGTHFVPLAAYRAALADLLGEPVAALYTSRDQMLALLRRARTALTTTGRAA